jgi:xylulokinase
MITLGVDVGTTHTKVLALDAEAGLVLATEAAATPVVADGAGSAHRPAQVLETVVDLARRVVGRLAVPARVRALCVASVGEEVVLIDRAGAPVGDAIAWYDPRGLAEARAFLTGRGGDLMLSRRWPPDATFSIFKLLWLREHAPAQLEAATHWTDLGDYVLHGLGGELVMDWSHASRAGAFDLAARAWDRPTIDAVDVPLVFPRLVPGRTPVGTLRDDLATEIGPSGEVVLVTGGHDHLCAAFGAGLRSTRELFLSAGTSEAHLSLLDGPLEGEAASRVDQGCYVDESTWYAHVNIHSGHFFQQWRQLLYGDTDDEVMYRELEAATAGDARFEVSDEMRLGRFEAVSYDADRAVVMRAVLEGLARRSAAVIERLESASGHRYEQVLVAGHPAAVPLWRSLRQAAYDRPMAAVDAPEPTAYGAAVMAAEAVQPGASDSLAAARTDWV